MDISSVTLLFDAENSRANDSVLSVSSADVTLADVTTAVLQGKYNIQQPATTAVFSQELRNYISENVGGEKGEALLAKLDALERLTDEDSTSGSGSVSQLLESQSGKVVDLLG